VPFHYPVRSSVPRAHGPGIAGADLLLADALLRTGEEDRQAFRQVYTLTSSKLFGICLRICGDRQSAEDVLHDVYVLVWKRAGAFDPARGKAITWLATITRNRSIDWHRAKHVRSAGSLELIADAPDLAPDAESCLMEQEGATRLNQCLAALNPTYRDAICTAFFDGMTYAEAAACRGVPLGTMKSRIRRGLSQLRKGLDSVA